MVNSYKLRDIYFKLKIDECYENYQCKHGNCVPNSYGFSCKCFSDYSGEYCETHLQQFFSILVLAFVLSSAILVFRFRHCKSIQ